MLAARVGRGASPNKLREEGRHANVPPRGGPSRERPPEATEQSRGITKQTPRGGASRNVHPRLPSKVLPNFGASSWSTLGRNKSHCRVSMARPGPRLAVTNRAGESSRHIPAKSWPQQIVIPSLGGSSRPTPGRKLRPTSSRQFACSFDQIDSASFLCSFDQIARARFVCSFDQIARARSVCSSDQRARASVSAASTKSLASLCLQL